MRVLFVCSQNRLRSPTAEAVFSEYDGLEVSSAGTASDAVTPISVDLIEWADIVFAMENHHRNKLQERYGKLLETKRLVVLRIPDVYKYMEPELIEVLKNKVPAHLRHNATTNRST
jgi:predicted protein tyrosine phosphatase